MKNIAIILISSGLTWFIAKSSDDKENIKVVEQTIQHEDSLLKKLDQTHAQLNQSIQSGDKKVVSIIDGAANKITTLTNKVVELTAENKTLKNEVKRLTSIVDGFTSDNATKFNLEPINQKDR